MSDALGLLHEPADVCCVKRCHGEVTARDAWCHICRPIPARHPESGPGVKDYRASNKPDWQPLVGKDGAVVTLTWEQVYAVQRAFGIWREVYRAEKGKDPDMTNSANWMKSCLLGRLLTEGKPPLVDAPPVVHAAPDYSVEVPRG